MAASKALIVVLVAGISVVIVAVLNAMTTDPLTVDECNEYALSFKAFQFQDIPEVFYTECPEVLGWDTDPIKIIAPD